MIQCTSMRSVSVACRSSSAMMDFSDRVSEALPAATAVVVRQSGSGREVLLLKRSDQLKHMPGFGYSPVARSNRPMQEKASSSRRVMAL